jgi:hypothetical protein
MIFHFNYDKKLMKISILKMILSRGGNYLIYPKIAQKSQKLKKS